MREMIMSKLVKGTLFCLFYLLCFALLDECVLTKVASND